MEEIRRGLKVCGDTPWRGLVLIGLYPGQRLGDCARLTWPQVFLVNKTISFVTRKTGQRLSMRLTDPLAAFMGIIVAECRSNGYRSFANYCRQFALAENGSGYWHLPSRRHRRQLHHLPWQLSMKTVGAGLIACPRAALNAPAVNRVAPARAALLDRARHSTRDSSEFIGTFDHDGAGEEYHASHRHEALPTRSSDAAGRWRTATG